MLTVPELHPCMAGSGRCAERTQAPAWEPRVQLGGWTGQEKVVGEGEARAEPGQSLPSGFSRQGLPWGQGHPVKRTMKEERGGFGRECVGLGTV